jgi:hypothetical protein
MQILYDVCTCINCLKTSTSEWQAYKNFTSSSALHVHVRFAPLQTKLFKVFIHTSFTLTRLVTPLNARLRRPNPSLRNLPWPEPRTWTYSKCVRFSSYHLQPTSHRPCTATVQLHTEESPQWNIAWLVDREKSPNCLASYVTRLNHFGVFYGFMWRTPSYRFKTTIFSNWNPA